MSKYLVLERLEAVAEIAITTACLGVLLIPSITKNFCELRNVEKYEKWDT